jgi:hypothetical protein
MWLVGKQHFFFQKLYYYLQTLIVEKTINELNRYVHTDWNKSIKYWL